VAEAIRREYKNGMLSLRELQERRDHDCRLAPERALHSLEEAHDFLRDRRLLTRTPDSALPSFFEACHEDPYKPGAGGFGSWPATKWPWYEELARRPGVYALKIHRGKHVLLTDATAALADPILRAETERIAQADSDWRLLLEHLDAAGPSTTEDLRVELGLKPKELRKIVSPLERCGVVVSNMVVLELAGGGHEHPSQLTRWDHAYPRPSGEGGIEDLTVAAVRAAVVAPEREVPRWFSWSWLVPPDLVDRLVSGGRLVRPEPGWVAAPPSASG
jgi:hypothetical protein